ncbi:ChaN family lipoprotein [Jiella sp. M17.18]|uniref:ChaN family lipoprotein n=1 Tax=Jiella sp. M17.18 TaxID=3234247 RepID=UPI0034DECEA9
MKRADWILPTVVTVLAGLGYAVADNAQAVIAKIPLKRTEDSVNFVPPREPARMALPYRKDGDNFADVQIATVKPFERDADDAAPAVVEAARASAPEARGPSAGANAFSGAPAGPKGAAAFLTTVAQSGKAAPVKADADASKPLATPIFDAAAPVWQSRFLADNPLVGGVFRADGTRTDASDLVGTAAGARYVLLGEIHDNPDHHRIQADIVGDLAEKANNDLSLVFEMIPRRFAEAAERFGKDGTDPADFAKSVRWNERGWPDFQNYRPIFDTALAHDLPIFAGDLDAGTVSAIAREGAGVLQQAEQERLGLTGALPADEALALAGEIKDAHCGLLPDKAVAPMVDAQRARDGALADAMMQAADATGRAVLIAGDGHVRNDRAVPSLLHQRQPGEKSVSVQMVEVAKGEAKPSDYGLRADAPAPYDFTIFTPRADMTDQCAKLQAKMQVKAD